MCPNPGFLYAPLAGTRVKTSESGVAYYGGILRCAEGSQACLSSASIGHEAKGCTMGARIGLHASSFLHWFDRALPITYSAYLSASRWLSPSKQSFSSQYQIPYDGGQPSQAETMGWSLHGADGSAVISLHIAPFPPSLLTARNRMHAFNQSLKYDQRMHAADIRGSIAYAKALTLVGILTKEEETKITQGLTAVDKEWESGQVNFISFSWRLFVIHPA